MSTLAQLCIFGMNYKASHLYHIKILKKTIKILHTP